MQDQINELPPKKRTAAAIATAFGLYLLLLLLYALLMWGFIWVGAKYDQTDSWKAAAILFAIVPNFLASFGAQVAACRLFRHANCETIFYAFSTGLVFLAFAVLIGRDGGLISALLTGVLGVGGAWLGRHYSSVQRK